MLTRFFRFMGWDDKEPRNRNEYPEPRIPIREFAFAGGPIFSEEREGWDKDYVFGGGNKK